MKILILFLISFSAFAQFTPLPPLPVVDGVLVTKGSLLTSTGTNQIPFAPCLNDQIIVWDTGAAGGFKCEAKVQKCTVYAVNGADDYNSTSTYDIGWEFVLEDSCSAWGNTGNALANLNDTYTSQFNGYIEADLKIWNHGVSNTNSIGVLVSVNGAATNGIPCNSSDKFVASNYTTVRCKFKSVLGNTYSFRPTSTFNTYDSLSVNDTKHSIILTEEP